MTATRETHTPIWGLLTQQSSLTLPCTVARDQTAIWDQPVPTAARILGGAAVATVAVGVAFVALMLVELRTAWHTEPSRI
jgi:hypothetical protein